ncbi:NAD(P)H-binding protein [Arthrobacter sp. FW305-123]|nr:NAD(P)H-binding protein [Arthrobacter sp. FW305-123]
MVRLELFQQTSLRPSHILRLQLTQADGEHTNDGTQSHSDHRAGGQIGGVSRLMVDMLLEQGHPMRAFVRRKDERAQSMSEAGADVFVGDLLKPADTAAALKGVKRIFFSMTPQPYYADALTLMAAVAQAQGDIETFVHLSNYEQSYMTLEKMTAQEENGVLGSADWSRTGHRSSGRTGSASGFWTGHRGGGAR